MRALEQLRDGTGVASSGIKPSPSGGLGVVGNGEKVERGRSLGLVVGEGGEGEVGVAEEA